MDLILGILGVLFVGLKLAHVIDWNWFYVTMPFWSGVATVFAVYAFVGILHLIIWLIERFTMTKEEREEAKNRRSLVKSLEKMTSALRRIK